MCVGRLLYTGFEIFLFWLVRVCGVKCFESRDASNTSTWPALGLTPESGDHDLIWQLSLIHVSSQDIKVGQTLCILTNPTLNIWNF